MNWGAPYWLAAIVAVALLALIVAGMGWRHGRRLQAAFGPALLEQILPGSVRLRRGFQAAALLVGLALVVVALAEPRFDKQIRTVQATGVDLVIVLDLSRSMDAQDVEPSRLERARREISDLFRALQGDRVGLVVYAGDAWPRLPLTEDLAAVQLVLSELDTGAFEAQGSALGAAIREGVGLLGAGQEAAGKALLILSDGEIHEGDDAVAAADEAAEAGVAIYAMGIGEAPAPIPFQGGWLAYNDERVMSAPDDTVLREVAKRTGGAYVKSVASPADVVGLYESEMRRKLTTVAREMRQREVWRSAFQWPLGFGLGFLLFGAWLGDGRRALGAAAGAVLAVGLLGAPEAVAATVVEADAAYRDGRYADAARELTELSLEHPTDAGIFDRLGAARYRTGDFEGAARAWDTVRRLTGGTDVDATYNAGNAHWMAGRLEEAADRFSEVLGSQPLHEQARANAELLAKELDARRNKPPPPPPKPQNSGEDEENQDGGGEQDQDPTEGGEGDQQPQDGNDAPPEQPQGDSDPQGDPDGGGDSRPELSDLEENPDAEGDSDTQPVGAGNPQEGEEGEQITAGQAERLLDSIEEGQPALRKRGTPDGLPW